jgi:hypothetical protein
MDHIWCIIFNTFITYSKPYCTTILPSVKVLHLEGDMSNALFISIPSLLMREGNNKGLVNKGGPGVIE